MSGAKCWPAARPSAEDGGRPVLATPPLPQITPVSSRPITEVGIILVQSVLICSLGTRHCDKDYTDVMRPFQQPWKAGAILGIGKEGTSQVAA